MARAPATISGRALTVVRPISFGIMASRNGSVPCSRTVSAAFSRLARASGGIRLRTRIAYHERVHPRPKTPPEFKQNVPADRASDECRLANTSGIEHAGNVARVLLHEGRPFANLRMHHVHGDREVSACNGSPSAPATGSQNS